MNNKCYLCNNLGNLIQKGVRCSSDLNVFQCNNCGLIFLSSFDHIVSNFYESSNMIEQDILKDIKERVKHTEADDERRFQYVRLFLQGKTLLDFGCGTGNFLRKARTVAKEVYGIEIEEKLNKYFHSLKLNVSNKLSSDKKYDIITIFHVLEHLCDPRQILVDLSKQLNKGGRIIVEVPNSEDALITLYANKMFMKHFYWKCHLFYFNTKTLGMLAKQAGFKINYIKQIQRYPLSNHLFWLSKSEMDGHRKWNFIDSKELKSAYKAQLAKLGKCDTLLAEFLYEERIK